MKKNNKKGFTLIELLAVIVILGVVMAVAIPSMQKVINNSKKDTLISTAQEYINGAKTMLTSESELPDYSKVLVVPIEQISLDRGGKSPFTSTDFTKTKSYVVVQNKTDTNGNAESDYEYYITLADSSGNCLNLVSEKNLNNKAKVTRKFIASGTSCKSTELGAGSSLPGSNISGNSDPSAGDTYKIDFAAAKLCLYGNECP